MSKEVDWSEMFGVGTIVCSCDNCSSVIEHEFDDNRPSYAEAQVKLRQLGWLSCKFDGKWYDFCCEKCRNIFIKTH